MRAAWHQRSGRCRGPRAGAALPGLALLLSVVVMVLSPAAASGRGAGTSAASTFVSGDPISDADQIDQYSLLTGGRVGKALPIPSQPSTARDPRVSEPHVLPDGEYLITLDRGANCATSGSHCHPIANSCGSQIETISPVTRQAHLLFTVPGTWEVYDAVPSPSGRSVALLEGLCDGAGSRVTVRNLLTGAHHVVANHVSCDLDPTWARNGTELAFGYASAKPAPDYPDGACGLALAPASRTSTPQSRTLIPPPATCTTESAAVDSTGVAATEICDNGGANELVQYSGSDRVLHTLSLDPDYSEAIEVASDLPAHTVLVSQIISDEPDESLVSTFNGTKLHLVGDYFDAAILAQP